MGKLASLVLVAVVCITSTPLDVDAASIVTRPTLSLSRPPYIECQTSDECGVGNCCVLGMGRFSIPTCQPLLEVDNSCRPFGHRPFNTTVGYPDGATVQLANIYRLFCPCSFGLSCDMETTTCQEDTYIYNTLIV